MANKNIAYSLIIGIATIMLSGCTTTRPATMPDTYKLVWQENFKSASSLKNFTFTDTSKWSHNETGVLECKGGEASYQPPVRSPRHIALIDGQQFGSFILEARLQQTGREYDHQDMCLFFGFQNPSQFYYTHISRSMDDYANQIFIVNKKPRTKISSKTNDGQDWQNGKWHHVRLERDIENGLIRVFFDDMNTPVMEATNRQFGAGAIGFGTFDDSGMIDDVRVWSDTSSKISKIVW